MRVPIAPICVSTGLSKSMCRGVDGEAASGTTLMAREGIIPNRGDCGEVERIDITRAEYSVLKAHISPAQLVPDSSEDQQSTQVKIDSAN